MSLPLVLRPEATQDLQDARAWYEQQRSGLGAMFATRAAAALDGIEAFPESYGVVWQDVRAAPVRKHPLTSFTTACWPIASRCSPSSTPGAILRPGKAGRKRTTEPEEPAMRFDLRLRGQTASGQKCQADVSVYADGQKELMEQADIAARSAAWLATDPPHDPIPEGSQITIEGVEKI